MTLTVNIRLLLLFILLSTAMPGCAVLPAWPGEAEQVNEHDLELIEVGKSTKDDVSGVMKQIAARKSEQGDSVEPLQFRNGESWLYAQTRREMQWVVIFYTAGDVLPETHDYRYLLINFDFNGVVADYNFFRSEKEGCNEFGICTLGSGHMLAASMDESVAMENSNSASQKCDVYLYGLNLEEGVAIWLDSKRVGWVLGDDSFLHLKADPGIHRLKHRGDPKLEPLSEYFGCQPGQQQFFRLTRPKRFLDRPLPHSIKHDQPGVGSIEIKNRKRLLPVTHFPQ